MPLDRESDIKLPPFSKGSIGKTELRPKVAGWSADRIASQISQFGPRPSPLVENGRWPPLGSCPLNKRYIVAMKMGRRQSARREHI